MGKKVNNSTKKIKTETKPVEKEEKLEKKSTKKDKVESPKVQQSKSKSQKKTQAEKINDEKDEQILNENEETQIEEDLNKRYEFVLKDVKEKIGPSLDKDMIMKAIKCLKKIVLDKYQNSMNILENESDEILSLNIVLGKLPFKFSIRPCLINLPHSLYSQKFMTRVCLFVKDPLSDFEDLNIQNSFPFDVKVIDVTSLKLNYSRFEDRRKLLKEFEIFLCDSKIYFLLKKLLGKPFYVSRKYPLPLKPDYSNPEEIKNLIIDHVEKSSTFYMSHGPNYSIKISRAISTPEEILDNIFHGLYQTLGHILKWGGSSEE
jgi:hypothetical protein